MATTTYNFRGYPATARAVFTCEVCDKPNRTRTFRVECTVNPFNLNDDGSMKTPEQVRAQSRAKAERERTIFMRKPVCKSCEDQMSSADYRALQAERKAAA